MKCDRAGHLLTTDAMSEAQTLLKLARSASLSRPDPGSIAWSAGASVPWKTYRLSARPELPRSDR
jgi:hypothetical protein